MMNLKKEGKYKKSYGREKINNRIGNMKWNKNQEQLFLYQQNNGGQWIYIYI